MHRSVLFSILSLLLSSTIFTCPDSELSNSLSCAIHYFGDVEGTLDFQLDEDIIGPSTAIAGLSSLDQIDISGGTVSTNIVTYEQFNNGVTCHIGWYADGLIATVVHGPEQGKQVVIVNDQVFDISYDTQTIIRGFVHFYTWGVVTSYFNTQITTCY